MAKELGFRPTTMHGWVQKYKESPETPFPGSGHLRPEDERLRKLEREIKKLKEENEILKKAAGLLRQEPKIRRFEFIKANCNKYRIAKLCGALEVSRSSYYSWDRRPESNRSKENKILLKKIKDIHNKSGKVYSSIKMA